LELAANSEIDLAGELIEASQAISHLRLALKKTRKEKDLAQGMTKPSIRTKLAKQNKLPRSKLTGY